MVCNTVLRTKVPLDRLIEYSPEDLELGGLLRPRGSMVTGFFAVSSVFLSALPLFGPLWAIAAVLLNRKSPAWMRITAKVGLALSVLMTLLFLYRITTI